MSTKTPNFGFTKPELTDPADITALNQNWDTIDSELNDKLPKSGGVITKDDNIPLILQSNISNVRSLIGFNNQDGELLGAIGYFDSIPKVMENDGHTTHMIHHGGNKPRGSYLGDGGTTSRTIFEGADGLALLIVGGGFFTFVVGNTARAISVSAISNIQTGVGFNNGKFTLSSAQDALNKSGTTYHYQVL